MRSFVFISFAMDCIEKKKQGFLFSSMESGEEWCEGVGLVAWFQRMVGVGGNAATVD